MKKIALINDLSGFGKCSLAASLPVISVLGIQACPLPTAILSAQTEFPSYYCDDFTGRMNRFTDEWARMHVSFDGICSGFLGNAAQMQNVLYFLEKFHQKNTLYLADPVMGDNGNCLCNFSPEFLDGMRELTRHAGIITPNLTELCLLAGADYHVLADRQSCGGYLPYIEETARSLAEKAYGMQTVVVTGIIRTPPGHNTFMGNLAVTPEESFYIEMPYTGKSFSGTGDLIASVIAGSMVNGLSVEDALKAAAAFLQPAIEEASRSGTPEIHGIPFEKYLYLLL